MERLSLSSRVYLSAFRALLDSHRFSAAVRITQLLRVDLDGDGRMEVLAALTNAASDRTYSSPGEYSVIAVRWVDSAKRVHTQALDVEKHPREGGLTRMRFGPPVDLNGDGKLEVIVRGSYVMGKYTHVLEWRGEKFVRVLECSCGG
ncbi:MAG: hypothetical protein NTY38_24160 [Acidobacteria bacterium]|nr:hypothetical protein [Acidobacteriota bacterium]